MRTKTADREMRRKRRRRKVASHPVVWMTIIPKSQCLQREVELSIMKVVVNKTSPFVAISCFRNNSTRQWSSTQLSRNNVTMSIS